MAAEQSAKLRKIPSQIAGRSFLGNCTRYSLLFVTHEARGFWENTPGIHVPW